MRKKLILEEVYESGEIKYISNIDDINNEETKDFIVAVKRINQMTGIGFLFSYYNKNTYRRIVIESSFTPLIDGKNRFEIKL